MVSRSFVVLYVGDPISTQMCCAATVPSDGTPPKVISKTPPRAVGSEAAPPSSTSFGAAVEAGLRAAPGPRKVAGATPVTAATAAAIAEPEPIDAPTPEPTATAATSGAVAVESGGGGSDSGTGVVAESIATVSDADMEARMAAEEARLMARVLGGKKRTSPVVIKTKPVATVSSPPQASASPSPSPSPSPSAAAASASGAPAKPAVEAEAPPAMLRTQPSVELLGVNHQEMLERVWVKGGRAWCSLAVSPFAFVFFKMWLALGGHPVSPSALPPVSL